MFIYPCGLLHFYLQPRTEIALTWVPGTPGLTVALISMLDGVPVREILTQDVLASAFHNAVQRPVFISGQLRIIDECGGRGVQAATGATPTGVPYCVDVRIEVIKSPGITFAALGHALPFAGSGHFACQSQIAACPSKAMVIAALSYLVLNVALRRTRWCYLLDMYACFFVFSNNNLLS